MVDESTLLNAAANIEGWNCGECGSIKWTTASFYLLKDNTVLEHVVCAECGYDDHTAELYMRISLDQGDNNG